MPSDVHPLTETLAFATSFIYQNMVQPPKNLDTIAKKARRLFAKSKKPRAMPLLRTTTVKEQEAWVVRQLASEHGVDEQQVFHHLLVSTNPPPPPPNPVPATAMVPYQTPLSPPRAPRSSPNAARSPMLSRAEDVSSALALGAFLNHLATGSPRRGGGASAQEAASGNEAAPLNDAAAPSSNDTEEAVLVEGQAVEVARILPYLPSTLLLSRELRDLTVGQLTIMDSFAASKFRQPFVIKNQLGRVIFKVLPLTEEQNDLVYEHIYSNRAVYFAVPFVNEKRQNKRLRMSDITDEKNHVMQSMWGEQANKINHPHRVFFINYKSGGGCDMTL